MTILDPDEAHEHPAMNPIDTGERHWATIDENGEIRNIIVCDSAQTALELGYPIEVTGLEVGIGWTTLDGGGTWLDTRSAETEARRLLRGR